jgi:alpha-mannosidase
MPYHFEKTKQTLYTIQQRIDAAIYQHVQALTVNAWITPEPVPYAERESGQYKQLTIGESWGQLWDCAWMHLTGQVPTNAAGNKVVLLIDLNGEALLVDTDGNPALGLTTVSSQFDLRLGMPGKRVVELLDPAHGDELIDIWLDAAANDLFGEYKNNGQLREAHIATCSEPMRQLSHDFFVLHEMTVVLPETSARRAQILRSLFAAANQLVDYTAAEAEAARAILAPELAKTGGSPSLTLSAIGHAHMDLAWLWPLRETIRKGARTFATVLAMMDRYPDYVFGGSQPQLYQWVKTYYPALYERVKQKIAEGRWEVQGGMWVEPDTNISGGEALVRQLLYGIQFFEQEFGKTPRMLWLPDVFGYSGALPQLLKKSGIDYFMTIKISWSLVNNFPHHTFNWEGIDGSRVLAHMPPEGTYNSSAAPRAIVTAEKEFRDKYVSDRALLIFGIGDGGGGPGTDHLENLAREKNLAGLAPVVQEPAEKFFDAINHDVEKYHNWKGELYLEYHQGTLTSQARNKRANRKIEYALRNLEFFAAVAHFLGIADYPGEALLAIWREALLYQFHDILPGSSITRVYTESVARYAVLTEQVAHLTQHACDHLFAYVDTSKLSKPLIVTNTLSWTRTEWLKLPSGWAQVQVPSMGFAAIEDQPTMLDNAALNASPTEIENDLLHITFDADGSITSVFDKAAGLEVLSATANILAVYDDKGDAWDFPFDYDEKVPRRFALVSVSARIDGPQARIEQRYQFGASSLTQTIILTLGSKRLDFVTEVDWRESHKMLRTRFPVSITANDATCDIQFGSIKRPTHTNTSWDMARTEVAAHKWIDLSRRDYGVALLNDCKYGHNLRNGQLDLALLRSPQHPDPVADHAVHHFTYALFPHTGDHIAGRVIQAGYGLNIPIDVIAVTVHAGALPVSWSLIDPGNDQVIVEAVKKAETSDALIIRLYESTGANASSTMTFGLPIGSISQTNLIERNLQPVTQPLTFTPFEIRTVQVQKPTGANGV